ncbi:MAG: DEAD/DEAH box helicase family protein [Eubacterium sp.]|nr:DEAD/DEAH box helicase family protein [Eubacterium sp.]
MEGYNCFPGVRMNQPLRDYQARVIASLESMLDDGRVHIAAAPGSGKTVLGLELMRLLNRRTLILVPTVNLRNQWKERFLSMFIDPNDTNAVSYWNQNFSLDIKTPGIITCATYQALYSVYDKEEGFDAFIQMYKNSGVSTVVLDEAHHLKREWWKALTYFIEQMNPWLVALTATPPLDTSDIEWKRYNELCGDIDLEISIPEMVIKKCLCPHQDYLYICKPTAAEQEKVAKEIVRNRECQQQILRDKRLYEEIKSHPALLKPKASADTLLKNPDYLGHLISYAAYIRATWQVELEGDRFVAEKAYSAWDKNVQGLMETKTREFEAVSELQNTQQEWFLPLMKDILEYDTDSFTLELRDSIKSILTNNHLMKEGKLRSDLATENSDKILKNSASKLDAIVDIIQNESRAMGPDLRCLVLLDYIRKDDMSKVETEDSLTDLGVSTAFERIRRQEHLGNLEKYLEMETPDNLIKDRVYRQRIGVLTGSLVILPDPVTQELGQMARIKPLGVTGYSQVEFSSDNTEMAVSVVTDLFQRGRIEILIGTSALLGEGWDAPAVNTLIIGSTSAMYVKTNQMRGRALRLNTENPYKVSNIWHLMAVSDQGTNLSEAGSINKRFDSIVGLSMDGTRVENGIDRLKVLGYDMTNSEVWNKWMLERSWDRGFVYNSWANIPSIHKSSEVRNVVEIKNTPLYVGQNSKKAKRYMLSPAQQKTIAEGSLRFMQSEKLISERSSLQITFDGDKISFYLDGATERESRAYMNIIKQALSPLVSPKYMLRFGFFFHKYTAVPSEFSKREMAERYRTFIKGAGMLVPANDEKGKQLLINIRLKQQTISMEAAKMIRELI